MGQAKARKVEINNLKSASTMLHIHAIRHQRNGMQETIAFGTERSPKAAIDKDRILGVICDNEWLDNKEFICNLIAEYFIQTKSYKMMNMAEGVKPYGYEINFYETGAQADQPSNVYGCRAIVGIYSEATFHKRINQEIDDAKARGAFTQTF